MFYPAKTNTPIKPGVVWLLVAAKQATIFAVGGGDTAT
jgi:hypothetical protein